MCLLLFVVALDAASKSRATVRVKRTRIDIATSNSTRVNALEDLRIGSAQLRSSAKKVSAEPAALTVLAAAGQVTRRCAKVAPRPPVLFGVNVIVSRWRELASMTGEKCPSVSKYNADEE